METLEQRPPSTSTKPTDMVELTSAQALGFHNQVQAELNARLLQNNSLNPALAVAFKGLPDPFSAFIRHHGLNFEQSLQHSAKAGFQKIPRFTHKIWVTDPANPYAPTANVLYTYHKMLERAAPDWTHFFWTNTPPIGAQVQKRLQESGCAITIVDISTLSDAALYGHIEKLIAARKFALAADLLKITILDRVGGLYSDLGVSISAKAFEMFSLLDAGLAVCSFALQFQPVCTALPPKSTIAAAFTGIAAMPESFDAAVSKETARAGLDEVKVFGGANLALSAVLFSPAVAKTWIIPSQGTAMSVYSYGSWFGRDQQTFGNTNLKHAKPTIMQKERIELYRSVVKQNLIVHGDIGILRLQLELLIKLIPHYKKYPTELCKLLFFRGSDKAMGWHNYSILYNFLLARYVGRSPNVLEIGIGTNNLDVPSSVSGTRVPGASLRAWRDFFINGKVVGADVDKRILFSEPGISTYYVDQTKPSTIADLLAQLPKLDVIIDDGLPQFSANRNVAELAMPQLTDDGIMIIEDVPLHEKKTWDDYLRNSKLNAAIVDLPSDLNKQDNRLVFIMPSRGAGRPAW